jgi:phenylacetate-CoA ligase
MLDHRKAARAETALHAFIHTPLDKLLEPQAGPLAADIALELFRDVAAHVPAYAAFLKEHEIVPASIRGAQDFARLPLVTKANYLQKHPLPALCRGGRLESCDFLAVSSGSTGTPTFWPRFQSDELPVAARFEQVFHDSFNTDERRTLAVVCFALGTWVGGMFTTSCCRALAAKGYPITLATPGNNREEIWRVVKALAPQFDQTVLLGYPPFLKDVIDGGIAAGIDWKPYKVKLVMAGEVFSEEWRSLVAERLGATDICYDSASLYGTADAGVLGNETPLSICIRRFLSGKPEIARELFGESRLPTLVQYDPRGRYFESIPDDNSGRHTLLFTGDNGVPLIRYHIADHGGIVGYEAMLKFLAQAGFDPVAQLGGHGWRGHRRLPFAFVFGRSRFTVSFFGANIYPENISVGLEQPQIREWVTGKFVLRAVEGLTEAAHLAVAVELAPKVAGDEGKRDAIARSIQAELERLNSEFMNYAPAEYRLPLITLHAAGDAEWFPVGVKHRYTRK